jgi:uncharacterized membrane protein YdbT with pleckstrin-like domain
MGERWSLLDDEREIARVKPSNRKLVLLLVCTIFLYLPWFIVRFIQNKARTWILTNRRVIAQSGVFNQQTETVRLDRIQEVHLFRRFFDRLIGTESLVLESAADTEHTGMRLDFIPASSNFRGVLQQTLDDRHREIEGQPATPGGV